MKIPVGIMLLFLGAWLSLQAWALTEISALRVQVAALTARVDYMTATHNLTQKHDP